MLVLVPPIRARAKLVLVETTSCRRAPPASDTGGTFSGVVDRLNIDDVDFATVE